MASAYIGYEHWWRPTLRSTFTWGSVFVGFWYGGRTGVNGVEDPSTLQQDSRVGITASSTFDPASVPESELRLGGHTFDSAAITGSSRRRGITPG